MLQTSACVIETYLYLFGREKLLSWNLILANAGYYNDGFLNALLTIMTVCKLGSSCGMPLWRTPCTIVQSCGSSCRPCGPCSYSPWCCSVYIGPPASALVCVWVPFMTVGFDGRRSFCSY